MGTDFAEIWLPVIGWEEYYEISNRGRIWSVERLDTLGRPQGGFFMSLIETHNPKRDKFYYCVKLTSGKRAQPLVHRLELETFVGPCPPGRISRHLNDNGLDNRWPENICWGSFEENFTDAVENNGLHGWTIYNARRGH